MTYKEKFRAEIERRLNLLRQAGPYILLDECTDRGAYEAYKNMLKFVDSMQEDPVSADLEAEIEKYMDEHIVGDGFPLRDLTIWGGCVARYFAEWQKQQMMKNAVDGWLECNERRDMSVFFVSDHFDSTDAPVVDYNIGDKVKLIIIKED